MFDFIEDLKSYIENKFSADTDIQSTKRPKVFDAYANKHDMKKITSPEIQVHILDNYERQNYTTFCGKRANIIPVQITAYAVPMKIKGKEYNAQKASMIFGDKIEKIIYELIYATENSSFYNKNIYGGLLIGSSPALPLSSADASIYATAMRFNFTVASPYVKE